MKRWVTIFPECKNFHLIKDVGYIPYIMHKKFGFNSSILTFKEDNYDYTKSYLNGLKMEFLDKKYKSDKLAIVVYLIKNSKNIDVISLFHLKPKHLLYIFIYKMLNKNGKAYLKLDANETIKDIDLNSNSIKPFIYRKFLKYCDLISVETTELYEWLNANWKLSVKYIPNGFWGNDNSATIKEIRDKKNYITTVGRLGSEYKNTELLLDSFVKIYNDIPQWQLCLVGSMTKEFERYLNTIISKNPDIEDRIILRGYVSDLNELDGIYEESRIFCLTSISESFGLVFVEALKNGCYIVTSNVLAAKDVTNNEEFGHVFELNSKNTLADILREVCLEKIDKIDYKNIQKFGYEKFNWNKICESIYSYLGLED